jgi:hypothetical protein
MSEDHYMSEERGEESAPTEAWHTIWRMLQKQAFVHKRFVFIYLVEFE